MRRKEDFIQKLREDQKFQAALEVARSDEERAIMRATVENFVMQFAEVLAPIIDRAHSDPEFAKQIEHALIENREVVISTNDPFISGSTG